MAKGARSAGRKTNVQRTRWLGHKTALPRPERTDKGAAYLKTFGSRAKKREAQDGTDHLAAVVPDARMAQGAREAGDHAGVEPASLADLLGHDSVGGPRHHRGVPTDGSHHAERDGGAETLGEPHHPPADPTATATGWHQEA